MKYDEWRNSCPQCNSKNMHDLSLTMFYTILECQDCGCQWSNYGNKEGNWKITRKFNTLREWEEYKKRVQKNFRGDNYKLILQHKKE